MAVSITQKPSEVAQRMERAQECLDRGLILALFGESESAERFYRKALLIDSDNALGHYMLGVALMKNGEIDAALDEWRTTSTSQRTGSQADWAKRQAVRLIRKHEGHSSPNRGPRGN